MKERAWLLTVMVLFSITPQAASGADPCGTPEHPDYKSEPCKIARLRERPFVVVATVDTGINPYHVDFRLPADEDRVGIHPSEYIEGYPASTPRVDLSFDASSPAEGLERDSAQWSQVGPGQLGWVNGTNLIGVIGMTPKCRGTPPDCSDPPAVNIVGGHGTGVASVAGGRIYGQGSDNILLVSIASGEEGLAWAVQQPWIDVISNSWSEITPVLDTTAEASYAAVASGKVVCFASGNVPIPMWALESNGPSWNVNVGGVQASDRSEPPNYSWPNDVMGLSHVPAAAHDSMEGSREFGGTSGAAPAVCGLIAKTLVATRELLSDATQGPHAGTALAAGSPGSGYLSDGRLTRVELEDAVQSTASAESSTLPQATWVRAGYGIVDQTSIAGALKVIDGAMSRPERPDEDRWLQTTDAVRNAMWGAPPP